MLSYNVSRFNSILKTANAFHLSVMHPSPNSTAVTLCPALYCVWYVFIFLLEVGDINPGGESFDSGLELLVWRDAV